LISTNFKRRAWIPGSCQGQIVEVSTYTSFFLTFFWSSPNSGSAHFEISITSAVSFFRSTFYPAFCDEVFPFLMYLSREESSTTQNFALWLRPPTAPPTQPPLLRPARFSLPLQSHLIYVLREATVFFFPFELSLLFGLTLGLCCAIFPPGNILIIRCIPPFTFLRGKWPRPSLLVFLNGPSVRSRG